MIWWLAFEKNPFQFWREIWNQVVVILLQLYLYIEFYQTDNLPRLIFWVIICFRMTLLHSEFRSTTVNFWLHCEPFWAHIQRAYQDEKRKKNDAKERKKLRRFSYESSEYPIAGITKFVQKLSCLFFSARLIHQLVCKIVNDKSQHKYTKIVRKSKWNQIYRFRRPCQFWSKFQNSSHSAGQACERKNRGPNSLQCWNAVYLWFCSLATSIQQQQVFWAEHWPSPIFSFSLHAINVRTEIIF